MKKVLSIILMATILFSMLIGASAAPAGTPKTLTLTADKYEIQVGETVNLTAVVKRYASDKSVVWSVSGSHGNTGTETTVFKNGNYISTTDFRADSPGVYTITFSVTMNAGKSSVVFSGSKSIEITVLGNDQTGAIKFGINKADFRKQGNTFENNPNKDNTYKLYITSIIIFTSNNVPYIQDLSKNPLVVGGFKPDQIGRKFDVTYNSVEEQFQYNAPVALGDADIDAFDCLTYDLPTNVETVNYTALGDSIAAGFGLQTGEKSYVTLFDEYLDSRYYGEVNLTPYASNEGLTSGMLAMLIADQTPSNTQSVLLRESIRNPQIITISIGSNDLLGIVINFMRSAPAVIANLTAQQRFDLQLTAEQQLVLATAGNNITPKTLIDLKLTPTQLGKLGFDKALLDNASINFNTNIDAIITQIRAINATADIYVANLYNPFKTDDPLFAFFDGYIRQMNSKLDTIANITGVADVYTKFNTNEAKAEFTNFYTLGDPHPTAAGQRAIFEAHKAVFIP